MGSGRAVRHLRAGIGARTTTARAAVRLAGFDGTRLVDTMRSVPGFVGDLRRFRRAAGPGGPPIRLFPILADRRAAAGTVDPHYFFQDLWAARKIHERSPAVHTDVGSRIDGFIAHLLVFCDVDVIDVRPLDLCDARLRFRRSDATRLPDVADGSIESLSSLHAVEHFGLGRYGDPIDPGGHLEVMGTLARVLAPGGQLYLSVPVGAERVEFNAQRVLAPATVLDALHPLELVDCAIVQGNRIDVEVGVDELAARRGTGLFHLTKPTT